MSDFKEMTMEEWEATYKPIPNNIDKNASFQNETGQGIMFETYGAELEFVKKADPKHIWTYGDGDDGGSYIWNGFHFINRLGYFITEVPAPSEEECVIQIKVSSYWYYCEGCQAEIEDDGQLINDKFYEWECCPLCATPEQLKEIEEANA
jgi:hypothetical protein